MTGYNFTERVRKVLAMAREEAVRLHHEYVGTEHILLGLIREGEGVAAAVLQSLTADVDEIKAAVEAAVKKGHPDRRTGPDLPYTSRAKKALELSMSEARELNHSYVGTEHLLLGLLREEKGIAAQVLSDVAGLTIAATRAEALRLLGTDVAVDPRPARWGTREGPTVSSTNYVAAFGPALGAAYLAVRRELGWLYVAWDQYRTLYGDAERVELLNEVAPLFFNTVQRALADDILMRLDRLSDPTGKSGSKVSVHHLPALIEAPELRADIERLLARVLQRTGFVRGHQPRQVLHDLTFMLEQPAGTLGSTRHVMLKEALDALAAVLNRLNEHFRDSTTHFAVGEYPQGALSLLHALREVRDARQERGKRIAPGTGLDEETNSSPP